MFVESYLSGVLGLDLADHALMPGAPHVIIKGLRASREPAAGVSLPQTCLKEHEESCCC